MTKVLHPDYLIAIDFTESLSDIKSVSADTERSRSLSILVLIAGEEALCFVNLKVSLAALADQRFASGSRI